MTFAPAWPLPRRRVLAERRQVSQYHRGRLMGLGAGKYFDPALQLGHVEAPGRRVALQPFEQQLSICVTETHAGQP